MKVIEKIVDVLPSEFIINPKIAADVAELADAHDLGSCSERSGGSSPLIRTSHSKGFRPMAKKSVGNLTGSKMVVPFAREWIHVSNKKLCHLRDIKQVQEKGEMMSFEWNGVYKSDEHFSNEISESVNQFVFEYYKIEAIEELTREQIDELDHFRAKVLDERSVMQVGFSNLISGWELQE